MHWTDNIYEKSLLNAITINADHHPLCVRVPATAANLGPGFDVLGLALALYNDFVVRPGDAPLRITVEGTATMLPAGPSNLFYRAFAHLYAQVGQPVPPLDVTMQLHIPPGSGLGSSATAVVGGLLAANTWLGAPLTRAALLPLAVALEHGEHPDNVAPALLGGLAVNTVAGATVHSVRVPFPNTIKAVVYLPDFMMDTVQGRSLMPGDISQSGCGLQHQSRRPTAGRAPIGAIRPAGRGDGRSVASALPGATVPGLARSAGGGAGGRGLWGVPVGRRLDGAGAGPGGTGLRHRRRRVRAGRPRRRVDRPRRRAGCGYNGSDGP